MINPDGRKRPYVPATHALLRGAEDVGARHKAGHDDRKNCASTRPESALIVAALVPGVALGRGPRGLSGVSSALRHIGLFGLAGRPHGDLVCPPFLLAV